MTLGKKLAGAGLLAVIGAVIEQPGFADCGLDKLLTSVLPEALGEVAAGTAAEIFSDYTKEMLNGSNTAIVWPSDTILNHHLRKIVSIAIAGIIEKKSIECVSDDHLDLTALCLRLEHVWQMTASLNSAEAAALAESEMPNLVGGSLEDIVDRRPLSAADWRTLLQDLVMLSNDAKGPPISLSENTFEDLALDLEENFVLGLFSALCHTSPDSEAAYKQVQLLSINEIRIDLAKRFDSLTDDVNGLLQTHDQELEKVKEKLGSIEAQLYLASTPPSKVFPRAVLTGGISDFWFHSEWTTFQGRVKEYGALKEFLNGVGSSYEFRWSVLLGHAGSGKSRIALQLGRDSEALLALDKPGGWQMLYLESPSGRDQFNGWEQWLPAFPTLIVIDYAASRREDIWQIIKVLARRSKQSGPSKLPQPVRVLLLERSAAKALLEIGFNKLEDEPEFTYVATSHYKFSGDDLVQGKLKPLSLPPLDDLTLSKLLYQTYEERQGKGMSRHPIIYVEHLQEIHGDSRPLFAMLLGTRLAEDPAATDLKPRELAERLLKREHARWERYRVDHPELDEKLLHLLTLVCICSELEAEKAFGTGLPFLPATEPVEDLARIVFSWGGGYQDGLFSSLQPDFLRELYVLLRLNQGSFHLTEGETAVKTHTKALFEKAYAEEQIKPDVSFYFNALQNFPDLAQSENFLTFEGAPPSGQVLALRLLGMIADEDYLGGGEHIAKFREAFELALRSDDENSREIAAFALIEATATESTNAPRRLVYDILKSAFTNGAPISRDLSNGIVNLFWDETLLPTERVRLVKEIGELWKQSKDPEVRLAYAMSAFNAIKPDMPPDVRRDLVKEIKELWEETGDIEVRMRYARAIFNAIKPDMTPDERLDLVNEIKDLWEKNEDSEIVVPFAMAICNALKPDMTPDVRLGLVKEIKELWERSKDPEVRILYSQSAFNAIEPDMTPDVRQALVGEIKELLVNSRNPEVMLSFAKATVDAIKPDMAPDVRLLLVRDIRELWAESKDPEITLRYAKAAFNAIQPDMTPNVRQGLVLEIQELWEESKDPEVMLRYAKAALNAIQPDMTPDLRQGLVKQLKELWAENKDSEAMLSYALAAFRSIQPDMTPGVRLGLVKEMEKLWKESKDPIVRLEFVKASLNHLAFCIKSNSFDEAALGVLKESHPHVMENVDNPDWQEVVGVFEKIVQILESSQRE